MDNKEKQMRKYLVQYWTEQNDESTDLEKIIEAEDFDAAVTKFKEETRLFRRITLVKELPNFKGL